MGFNHRKMEDQRRQAVEKEAAASRATDAQVLEDAERINAAWNERQAERTDVARSGCQSTGYRYDRNQQADNRKEDRGL